MAGSTPVSGTDSSPEPPRRRRRAPLLRILRTPSGAGGAALVVVVATSAALAGVIAPTDAFERAGPSLSAPSWTFPMGTDDLGRDMLTGVLYGMRTSLILALAVTALASVMGLVVGSVAGYFGGATDDVLMRGTEVVQIIPRFFLAVLVAALFGPGLGNLTLVLGVTSWPQLARVVRSEVLSIREREFVESARSLGTSEIGILLRDVLPSAMPSMVVMASLVASSAILLEAGIGFVGLSDPDVISLGSLAKSAQGFLRVAWWMAVFPGVGIALVTLGINLLGDSVNDVLNPRLHRTPGTAAQGPVPVGTPPVPMG